MTRLVAILLFSSALVIAQTAAPVTPPPLPTPGAPVPVPSAPPAPVAPPAASSSPAHAEVPAPAPAASPGLPPAKTDAAVKATDAKAPAASSAGVQEAVIPQAFPRERYEASWKKNPFLLKTAPVVQAKESWGADWALTSIAKIGGTYRVGIKNKKTGEPKRLVEGSDANGEFKIVNVNLQKDRKSSSVEVEKGGEKVSLTYDAAMMAAQPRAGAPGAGGRPGTMPTIPGQPGGNIPMPNIRTTSTGGGYPGGTGSSRVTVPAPGGSHQPQVASAQGYMGNVGAAPPMYGGGAAGAPAAAGATPGAATNTAGGASRLGSLGPRAGAAQTNALVPMVGGTRVAGSNTYTGSTNTTAVSADAAAATTGVVPDGTTTTSGTNTPVTRRRTLIPAPVVSQ